MYKKNDTRLCIILLTRRSLLMDDFFFSFISQNLRIGKHMILDLLQHRGSFLTDYLLGYKLHYFAITLSFEGCIPDTQNFTNDLVGYVFLCRLNGI